MKAKVSFKSGYYCENCGEVSYDHTKDEPDGTLSCIACESIPEPVDDEPDDWF